MECFQMTACFIGQTDIEAGDVPKIQRRLGYILDRLVEQEGYRFFGTGGNAGFDMLAAERIAWMKYDSRFLGKKLKLISVLPFPDYNTDWRQEDKNREAKLLRCSDKTVYIGTGAQADLAYQNRTRHLIDRSSAVICYCNSPKGTTADAIRYAYAKGIPVYNACQADLRRLLQIPRIPRQQAYGIGNIPRLSCPAAEYPL